MLQNAAGSAIKYATVMCAKVVLPPIRRRRRPAEPSPVHASPGPTLLDLPFALSRTFTLFAVALFDCVCVCVCVVSQLVCVNALAIVVVATVRCVFLNYAKKKYNKKKEKKIQNEKQNLRSNCSANRPDKEFLSLPCL